MSRVATRRLLAASATLDAADRALLNIWVHRGLDDGALARMTGLHEAAVDARRVRIVTHLSATLGLPPETIRGALDEIAASADARPIAAVATPTDLADAPVANGALASEVAGTSAGPDLAAPAEVATPSADGSTPPATVTPGADLAAPPPSGGTPHTDAAASAAEEPAGGSASRRRRWLGGLPLIAIVVVVVLIVSLGSGGSGHDTGHSPRRAPAAAGAAAPAGTASPAPPSPTATANRSPGDPLVVLSGGPAHATGTALATGRRSHLRLHLSVSNLPAASHGHYEIWLYDSIIYARDLGRLPSGVSHLTLRLPPNARRFHWIDISFQPPGVVFHSGESLLRSANPLFGKAGARRP
jgi:hypothetical protein